MNFSNPMSRICRSATAIVTAVLAVTMLLQPGAARAQGVNVKIGFATINDPQHELGKLLAKRLGERSGGKLKAGVFPAGQIGKIARMIEALQLGTQEVLISPPGFLVGINPAFQVLDAPGAFDDIRHAHRAVTDPAFREPYGKLSEKAGIRMLSLYIYGPQVYASLRPIRTLGDFKGKKIRVLATKMEAAIVGSFGATGVPMPYVEVLPALQRKTIDGVRSSIVVMGGSKFFTVAKFVTITEGGMIPSAIFASQKWLDRLPSDQREMVIDTGRKLEGEGTRIAIEFAGRAEKLWKDNGAEIIHLSGADQKTYMAKIKPLGDKFLGDNPKTKPMYELLKASIAKTRM